VTYKYLIIYRDTPLPNPHNIPEAIPRDNKKGLAPVRVENDFYSRSQTRLHPGKAVHVIAKTVVYLRFLDIDRMQAAEFLNHE
jgi:hypothetical protein